MTIWGSNIYIYMILHSSLTLGDYGIKLQVLVYMIKRKY